MHITGFLRPTTLTFISKQQQNGEVWTFSFSPAKPLSHIAGQHGFFILPHFKGAHPYSLSSAPEEPLVSFTTRVRPESAHKQRLAAMQPGEKMLMLGPVLDFIYQDDHTDYVFLAQGIGITPFRSLLLHAKTQQLPYTTTLVHVDSHGHTFQEETSTLASQAFYPEDPTAFAATVEQITKGHPNALYYMSGSPKFIASIKQQLKTLGIAPSQFKTDSFFGY